MGTFPWVYSSWCFNRWLELGVRNKRCFLCIVINLWKYNSVINHFTIANYKAYYCKFVPSVRECYWNCKQWWQAESNTLLYSEGNSWWRCLCSFSLSQSIFCTCHVKLTDEKIPSTKEGWSNMLFPELSAECQLGRGSRSTSELHCTRSDERILGLATSPSLRQKAVMMLICKSYIRCSK